MSTFPLVQHSYECAPLCSPQLNTVPVCALICSLQIQRHRTNPSWEELRGVQTWCILNSVYTPLEEKCAFKREKPALCSSHQSLALTRTIDKHNAWLVLFV